MFPLGFLVLFAGAFLIDSAVKDRSPLATLKAILSDPANARTTLKTETPVTPEAGAEASETSTAAAPTSTASGAAAVAIAFARAQIGKPYVYGATGPNSYDCSGLVQAAYKQAGVSLPRTTAQMIFSGKEVAKADLQPGDLVFPDYHHVQIYTGSGNVVEAPRTGEKVREVAMWGFWRARRVA